MSPQREGVKRRGLGKGEKKGRNGEEKQRGEAGRRGEEGEEAGKL